MKTVDPLIAQLRDARHRRGVKPYVVSSLAGLGLNVVYLAEAGDRSPTLATLRAWADALDCDIELIPRSATPTGRRAA